MNKRNQRLHDGSIFKRPALTIADKVAILELGLKKATEAKRPLYREEIRNVRTGLSC